MAKDRKEYFKAYHKAHKKEHNARSRAYHKAHKKEHNARSRAYYKAHKEEEKVRSKAYYKAHKEEQNARSKAWYQAHKEESKAYQKADVNSLGQTKISIRSKSNRYLSKYGNKIPGYEIHHCCSYTEPYKFIYCSKEMHLKIHQYLRDNGIEADSDHFEQIKHLLDDTVVLYGL